MSKERRSDPAWVETLISNLLRGGVILSVTIVLVGIVFTFVHHPDYFSSRPALGRLIDAKRNYTNSIAGVAAGLAAHRGQAIAMLGILLLIATPVARVAVSIVIFVIERDRLYVAITSVVLLLLLLSFALGAAGG
jgi:Predicted membrane protein